MINRIAELWANQVKSKRIDDRRTKLYLSIYELIKAAILQQDLPGGSVLPATRLLSDRLTVSRSTVIKAYELLRLEGYIESKPGSGNIIKQFQSTDKLQGDKKQSHEIYPYLSENGKAFISTVSLINSTDDKSVAFRPGLPPLDIFPVTQWKNLSNLYWRHIKLSGLSYSPSSGNEQLKRTIANYLNISRKLKCDPEQIFIVSGSVQSLYILGNILLNPGDPVGIENPTFPNVHSIFKGLRAEIIPYGIDKEGVVVDDVENRTIPKLLHVTPGGHYPTGIRMSEERKKSLLKWAFDNQTLLVENDYEHELTDRYSDADTLFSLDENNRTIYLSTFNRLLHPSLRIGYMVVPYSLVRPVDAMLKHSHRFVAPSIQIVLNQFIEKKYIYAHFKQLWEVTEERKAIFTHHFNLHFEGKMEIGNQDGHSLQLLTHLPEGISDKKVVDVLAQHHIIAHPYSKCFITPKQEQGLILGYSSVRTPNIKRKLTQMQQHISALLT